MPPGPANHPVAHLGSDHMLTIATQTHEHGGWWDVSPAVTAALIALGISVFIGPLTQLWLLNRRDSTDRALAMLDHRLLAAKKFTVPLLGILEIVSDARRSTGVRPA